MIIDARQTYYCREHSNRTHMRTPAEPSAALENLIASLRRIICDDHDLDQRERGRIVILVDGLPDPRTGARRTLTPRRIKIERYLVAAAPAGCPWRAG